jgi:hypothetical protein
MVRRWIVTALVAGLPLAAAAGPQEDYEAGRKSYAQGDFAGAMVPLRRAADAGNAPAQALLAYVLDGAGEDAEAVKYYRMAAEQGDTDGEYGLARQLASGEGTAPDPRQAFELMGRAAAKGHKSAISALADAYIYGGLGLDAAARSDNAAALKWIEAAAEINYLPAMTALANAYKKGAYGLAPDPAKAKGWDDRIKAVSAPPKPEQKK